MPSFLRRRRVLPVLSAVVAFTACGERAGRSSTPRATIPDLPVAAPAPEPLEPSRFSVPLDYDFTPVLRTIERAVPRRFGSLDSVRDAGEHSRQRYAYEADRQPFSAYADGPLVRLETTLSYAAKGFYKPIIGPTLSAGCGDDAPRAERPRIAVELSTPITLDADWHLRSHARLDHVGPATPDSRDRCDVTFFHHDVTDRVVDAARQAIEARLGDIDRRIGRVDLDARFTKWWNLLARPIRLADGVWLLIDPTAVAIGPVTGRARVLTVPVTLTARPRIVTAAAAPRVSRRHPPPLGHSTGPSGFHILLDVRVDYATASALMARALVNRRFTEAGRTVGVRGVRVAPASGGRLSVAVDFTGDASGTLQLLGRPVLDTAAHQILVPDLDYDLDTDRWLIDSYAWLRSDALRAAFRERAQVPVDSALDQGRGLLLAGLNRTIGGVLTLSARVDTLSLRGVYVTRDGLVVRAEARGAARVQVRQR